MSSVCSIIISLADMYYLLELPLTSPFFIIYVGTFAVPIHSVHKVLSVYKVNNYIQVYYSHINNYVQFNHINRTV